MFDTNNPDGSQQPTPQPQQTEAPVAPQSVFDIPFEIQTEDDDMIPVNFDYGEDPNQSPEPTPQPNAEDPNAQQPNASEGLNFETPKPNAEAPEGKSQEEIIADLKAKGFAITEPGAQAPAEDTRIAEMTQLKNDIQMANELLAKDDDTLVREKFVDNLKREYTRQNRQHLIGSQEFEIELEADLEELNANKFNKKIVADNIRRDVGGYKSSKEQAYNGINSNIQQENEQRATNNKMALQQEFTNLHKNGFMNVDIPANITEKVYQDVITGKFNKKLKENHNLVAQFALFAELQDTFAEKLGQPTYGEGVKAAFDQLNENGPQGARNSLAQMSEANSGNGNQGNSVNGRFAQAAKAEEQTNQNSNSADGRF